MLTHKHIVIFAPPRSGTKLLANILEDFGYFKHGEWFALQTTKIKGNKSIRAEPDVNIANIVSRSEKQFYTLQESMKRFRLFKNIDKHEKSVITLWPNYLIEFPLMIYEFTEYHWLCIRRDPLEQMLSYYISSKNSNFDGLKISQSVTFKEDAFRQMYWNYHSACTLQDWLIENKSATLIDFNELIQGKLTTFGQSYEIKSKDEHTNLESLVENLDDVKSWYDKFEVTRLKN